MQEYANEKKVRKATFTIQYGGVFCACKKYKKKKLTDIGFFGFTGFGYWFSGRYWID